MGTSILTNIYVVPGNSVALGFRLLFSGRKGIEVIWNIRILIRGIGVCRS